VSRILKTALALCLCLCLSFSALSVSASADVQIDKLLTTTSTTPVALMDVGNISAATSTGGCYIAAYGWYDLSGNALSGKFSTDSCRVEIRVDTYDGFYFGEALAAYLNNESASVTVDASGRSAYISREYAPAVWQPTVVKNPGSETVEAGGWASFVATATYTSSYKWNFVSPEGKYYSVAEVCEKFPGLSTSEDGYEKMNVYGIPHEMDGWKLVCTFKGPGGSVDSSGAKITVKPDPAAVTPSPEPTPEPTPEATEAPEPVHEHEFSDEWKSNADGHWRECSCGEVSEEGSHVLTWTVVKEASRRATGEEEGRCSVCGYTEIRQFEFEEKAPEQDKVSPLKDILLIAFIVIAVIFLIIIFLAMRDNRRRRRRRKRRR